MNEALGINMSDNIGVKFLDSRNSKNTLMKSYAVPYSCNMNSVYYDFGGSEISTNEWYKYQDDSFGNSGMNLSSDDILFHRKNLKMMGVRIEIPAVIRVDNYFAEELSSRPVELYMDMPCDFEPQEIDSLVYYRKLNYLVGMTKGKRESPLANLLSLQIANDLSLLFEDGVYVGVCLMNPHEHLYTSLNPHLGELNEKLSSLLENSLHDLFLIFSPEKINLYWDSDEKCLPPLLRVKANLENELKLEPNCSQIKNLIVDINEALRAWDICFDEE